MNQVPIGVGGIETLEALVHHVRLTQPNHYARDVGVACAYLDGVWREDVETQLRRVFALTADAIQPVHVPVLDRVCSEKALVYEGSPTFALETADADHAPIEAAPDGTTWASVLEAADLHSTLVRVDRRTVATRAAFVRVTWSETRGEVRLDVFDSHRVFPLLDPDEPDISRAPVVALEIEPYVVRGERVRRFEVWTAIVDDAGATVRADVRTVDETGRLLDERPNPYTTPDGMQGTFGDAPAAGGRPVIPIVAFIDGVTSWPAPNMALVDAQRSFDATKSNEIYCRQTQAHGQWVDQQTERNAESWAGVGDIATPGLSRATAGTRDAPRAMKAQVGVVFGPGEIVSPPFGHALQHVTQGAQLAELREGSRADLRTITTMEGMPAATLDDTAQPASGFARMVEREPLEKYRRDRVATLRRATEWLMSVVRVVWNTHAEQGSRFLSASGVRAVFTPDRMRPVLDPSEAARLAQALLATGLYSEAQVLARIEGLSVEAARAKLEESAAERDAAKALRAGGAGPRVLPASLVPRVPVPDVEDDDAPPTDGADVAAPVATEVAAEKVSDTALNGAQVQALAALSKDVAAGLLSRDAAVAIIESAFLVPRERAQRMVG